MQRPPCIMCSNGHRWKEFLESTFFIWTLRYRQQDYFEHCLACHDYAFPNGCCKWPVQFLFQSFRLPLGAFFDASVECHLSVAKWICDRLYQPMQRFVNSNVLLLRYGYREDFSLPSSFHILFATL